MANTNPGASLGVKRQCPACGSRFYDLGKNPAKCPKCGKSHDVTIPVKIRRGKSKVVLPAGDKDDPLLKEKAKAEQKQKAASKPVREIEGVDLEEFEDIETLDAEEEIEELEEIEDIDALEEIEEAAADDDIDDEMTLEDDVDEELVDDIEDEEENDFDEDEEESDEPHSRSDKRKKK